MSIRLMSKVWELSLDHSGQSILMALADHAADDGSSCYPSIAYLAWKTGYSERQTQRIMNKLKQAGLIEPIAYEQGGREHTVHYQLHLEKGVKKSPFRSAEKGDISERVTFSTIKGDIAMSPEPSGTVTTTTTVPAQESLPTLESSPTLKNGPSPLDVPTRPAPEDEPEWLHTLEEIQPLTPTEAANLLRWSATHGATALRETAYQLLVKWPDLAKGVKRKVNLACTFMNWVRRTEQTPQPQWTNRTNGTNGTNGKHPVRRIPRDPSAPLPGQKQWTPGLITDGYSESGAETPMAFATSPPPPGMKQWSPGLFTDGY